MRLGSGSRLGPYEISAAIGAGGMGEVYRAHDTHLGRDVAIKVLPQELTNDRERLTRFEREARSASALNHPNIVTIHDFSSTDGDTWLVMELIRGESLRDAISRGPMPLKKVIAIATGIADGLAAAHRAALVHRDLKPENIMLTADGVPKILDFGLAKSADIPDHTHAPTAPQITRAGVVMGTATYMSPEQARGESVDFRTDQFSFGIIVYEMLTGRNPFRRASPADSLAAILNDDPPPLDDPLGWIVARCLDKNPDNRYGATSDLAHDLHRLTAAPSVSAVHRSGRVWWVAAVAAIAIFAALLLALFVRPKPAAMPAMDVAMPTPSIDEIAFGEILPPVTISPDGQLVVVAGTAADGIDRLWLTELRSGQTRPIGGSEHAHGVAFSPDSRSIAFSASGKIKTIAVDGGPARVICDVIPPGQLTWSGDTILFSQPAGIDRVSSSGGAPQNIVPVNPAHPEDVSMWPEFLPDGRHFLYLATTHSHSDLAHRLMLASIDGGAAAQVGSIESRTLFADGYLIFVRDGTLLAQRFDPDSRKLSGEARPLTDDVFFFQSTGLVAAGVSNSGLLVWRSSRRPSREVWLDRVGTASGSVGEAVFAGGRISPDGNRYAAAVVDRKEGTGDLWIFDLAQQTSQRLTFQSVDEVNPVWSADGKSLYYRCDVLGPPDVFRWKLGDDHGSLVYRGPAIEQPEDASPDGKSLLIVSYNRAVGHRIFVVPLDHPSDVRPFSTEPFNDASPRFSPDGRWVAYESDASGRPEIYVRPFGGGLPVPISSDGGTKPRWRSDGLELFFLAPRGRLMSVTMRGGAAAGAPKMLFQANDLVDFEPTANGSRFLAQIQRRPLDPPVHLLVSWRARIEGR